MLRVCTDPHRGRCRVRCVCVSVYRICQDNAIAILLSSPHCAENGIVVGTSSGTLKAFSMHKRTPVLDYMTAHDERICALCSSMAKLSTDHTNYQSAARSNSLLMSISVDCKAKMWNASLQPITSLTWDGITLGTCQCFNNVGTELVSGWDVFAMCR